MANFFQRIIDNSVKRSLENPNTPINGTTVGELFGTNKTSSGENVTQVTAYNFSGVYACTRILSGVISSMPFKVYEKTPEGRKEATDHPYYNLISKEPNNIYTKAAFIERAVIHYANWGNFFAEIKEKPTRLELIPAGSFKKIEISNRGNLWYLFEIKQPDGSTLKKKLKQDKVIHVANIGDGIIGKGVITHASETIGTTFAAEKYGAKFFDGNGRPPGLFTTDKDLKKDQVEAQQDFWKKNIASGKNIVISGGWKYTPIMVPPDAAQFLQTRQFSIPEIARWYGVPPDKLADMSRATFTNIEHNAIAFLQDTISPILNKFEAEYNRKLLTGNYYAEFNMNSYLRADTAAKAEQYRTGIQNAYMTIDEVRQKENMNPVENGNRPIIQSNMVHLDKLDDNDSE